MIKNIIENLPGFNCGVCGFTKCEEFADALLNSTTELNNCTILFQERFANNRNTLNEYLKVKHCVDVPNENIYGLVDKYEADFILEPLPCEHSCRETLYPFSKEEINTGDIIRYRPLACPMIHFAKVLNAEKGLITVSMIGPCNRLDGNTDIKDVGVCMVGGFEGIIKGKLPQVCDTVRFLPSHCMMQKVHSGVVVQLENRKVIIEGIHLAVWAPPVKRD